MWGEGPPSFERSLGGATHATCQVPLRQTSCVRAAYAEPVLYRYPCGDLMKVLRPSATR